MAVAGGIEPVTAPDGVTVAVREWGNPAGREILFIHGVGQSHLSFVRQMDADLARDHRIVAYDTRGHGASDKPLDPACYHEAERWADEVQAVIDAKQLRKPVLVGWSMGGRIIGQYLAVHGDKRLGGINFVAARAVADPSFSGTATLGLPVARPYDLQSRIAAASGFLRACFHQQPSDADFAEALAYNMLPPAEVLAAIRSWPSSIPATVAALRAVTVPTLVTHGRVDAVVLPAAAEFTASLIPGATVSWYDGCGHSPFFEDAARFNSELARFVAACV
jgi:pimeloyl-ACP methyl ester carboxylesterase